jgi:hypothetical protein
MKRLFTTTWTILPVGLLLLGFVGTAAAQRRWDWGPPPPADLSGTWYFNGDPNQPCQIIQRGPDRATVINERGSAARAFIRGDRLHVPEWSDGYTQGLTGRIRGDRILWPGSYWSRSPE